MTLEEGDPFFALFIFFARKNLKKSNQKTNIGGEEVFFWSLLLKKVKKIHIWLTFFLISTFLGGVYAFLEA